MSLIAAHILGYLVLTAAAVAMAAGAAGLFASRLRPVVTYSAVLQCGYICVGLAASLLTGEEAGYIAAVYQTLAAAAGAGLLWIAVRVIAAQAGDALPLAEDAVPPAWSVFCLTLACMSLVGLPPLAGLPAKIAIIHAGLREPTALFVVTIGAAALGAVSLWAYADIVVPMLQGRIRSESPHVSTRLRIAVDAMIAVLIAFGLVPYFGFALGAAITGGP